MKKRQNDKIFNFLYYICIFYTIEIVGCRANRGVSHYRILPVSRDIGWPVQQLDYFRYIKQHILTVDPIYRTSIYRLKI